MPIELSSSQKNAIKAALQIAAGATIIERLDNFVELYSNKAPSAVVTREEFQFAKDLLQEIEQKYFEPYGIVRPFNALHILSMQDMLENAIADRMDSYEYKVVFIRGDTGGCSFWRCVEPVRMLQTKYGATVLAECTHDVSYETLLPFDLIVVQRGLFGRDSIPIIAILERLRKVGKPIIYEVDDDFEGLLHDNPCFFNLTPTEKEAMKWFREKSDAIFTTTDVLAEALGFPEKTYVLPNSIGMDRLKNPVRAEDRDEILFVIWHGGASHESDLKSIEKDFVQLVKKREHLSDKIGKEIIFGLMGYFPNSLLQFMEFKFPAITQIGDYDKNLKLKVRDIVVNGRSGVVYIKGVETDQFHQYLLDLQPDIAFCPLLSNRLFNNKKSNIKVIESIVAGAAVVCSDVGPYSLIPDNVVMKTKTSSQMIQGIQDLILNEKKRQNLVLNGQKWVFDYYNLEKNVDLWHDALKKVLDKSKNLV